jgi:hypothetical protein
MFHAHGPNIKFLTITNVPNNLEKRVEGVGAIIIVTRRAINNTK